MEQIDRLGQIITLIHFVHQPIRLPALDKFPENVSESGRSQENTDNSGWRIACMPNMTEFHQTMYHPNYQRTDDYRAVTCPACKKSEAYKEAMERSA